MAGPTSIQKVPSGLLSYLDMKGTGANPVDLAMTVAPIVDVTEAYGYPLEAVAATTAIAAAGNEIFLEVPATERWRVVALGLGISAATTGGSNTAILGMRLPLGAGAQFVPMSGPLGATVAVGVPFFSGFPLANPLWLMPGTRLVARSFTFAGAGISLSLQAAVQRLRV